MDPSDSRSLAAGHEPGLARRSQHQEQRWREGGESRIPEEVDAGCSCHCTQEIERGAQSDKTRRRRG